MPLTKRKKPRKEKNGFRVPSRGEILTFLVMYGWSLGEKAELQIKIQGPFVVAVEAIKMWIKISRNVRK